MHPETLLMVARVEHQQRVAEATRLHQVVRALAGRRKAVRPGRVSAAPVVVTCDGTQCAQAVPRWAT